MKPIIIIFSLLGTLFLVFVVRLLSLTSAGPGMVSAPWWVYVLYLAIIFCGVMFVHSLLDDRRKEQKIIEEEGNKILSLYKKDRENQDNTKKSSTPIIKENLDEDWKRYSL